MEKEMRASQNENTYKKKFRELETILEEAKELEDNNPTENRALIETKRKQVIVELYDMEKYFYRKLGQNQIDQDRFGEVFVDFIMNVPRLYKTKNEDGSKNSLENYINHAWEFRKNDVYEGNSTEKKHSEITKSWDELTDTGKDGGNKSIEVSIATNLKSDYEVKDMAVYCVSEILLSIGKLFEHGYGKKNNPVREKYYKLFATEMITNTIKEFLLTDQDISYENKISDGINEDFMDFFTRQICRSVQEICDCELKSYAQIGTHEKEDKEITYPFEAMVYMCYLEQKEGKKPSPEMISQNKKYYREITDTIKKQVYK